MKTLITIITATIFITSLALAQTPLKLVKEKVGNPDILKNWEVGETKTANQASILRLEGENDYDFLTNVFYTPKSVIMNLIDEKATAQALLPGQKDEMLQHFEASASGGQIALFYSRPSKAFAEPGHFTVQVLDEQGNKIWSGTLEKEQPNYYKWEIWYYYKTINLPVEVNRNFIIKVDDAGARKSYKFHVAQDIDTKDQLPSELFMKQTLF